jgi:hypothetical protein
MKRGIRKIRLTFASIVTARAGLGALILLTIGIHGIARAADDRKVELGVDRSNLTLQSEDVRRQTLRDIGALHAVWFRDIVNSSTPQGAANLVDVIGLAKQQGLKVLLNVVQLDADFPGDNAGARKNTCGWSEKPFSRADPERVKVRLRTVLGAIKAANLSVDAFEIGNEDDSYCYNPDMPNGREANAAELQAAARGYAKFLQAAATTIKQFFPQAKLVTFGIAHGWTPPGRPSEHLTSPARFIAMLKNVDGVNYIDNPAYRIDGYGTHLYTSPNDIGAFKATLQQDMSILGRDRPFWVTESGFQDRKYFPNKKGQSLSEAIDELYNTFDALARDIPIGPVMFFSYDGWLADPPGHLLPAAQGLARHGRGG